MLTFFIFMISNWLLFVHQQKSTAQLIENTLIDHIKKRRNTYCNLGNILCWKLPTIESKSYDSIHHPSNTENLRPCSHSAVIILRWERNHLWRYRKKESTYQASKSIGTKMMILIKFSEGTFSLQLCLASLNPKWNFRGDVICLWKAGLQWKCWQALPEKIVVSWEPLISLTCKWQYLYT